MVVTWEIARDWIGENSSESKEELRRIQTEWDLWVFLKDGKVLLRLLMQSKQQKIEGVKYG